jgi:hypothetical protein
MPSHDEVLSNGPAEHKCVGGQSNLFLPPVRRTGMNVRRKENAMPFNSSGFDAKACLQRQSLLLKQSSFLAPKKVEPIKKQKKNRGKKGDT